jgi:predicted nucleic acid-binding protein
VIFVDTSVWIAAYRAPGGREASTLRSLLDADEVNLPLPVRIELLGGTPRKDRQTVRVALTALPLSVPGEETWEIVDGWVSIAADAGHHFGVSDFLIAALTHEHGGLVWSLDRHFEAMEKLGFVRRYS